MVAKFQDKTIVARGWTFKVTEKPDTVDFQSQASIDSHNWDGNKRVLDRLWKGNRLGFERVTGCPLPGEGSPLC